MSPSIYPSPSLSTANPSTNHSTNGAALALPPPAAPLPPPTRRLVNSPLPADTSGIPLANATIAAHRGQHDTAGPVNGVNQLVAEIGNGPYPGLTAFTQKGPHALLGRQATLSVLLEKLRRFNFVPLIGPVGSGKSSLLQALLLPQLADQGWQVLGPIRTDAEGLEALLPTLRTWIQANVTDPADPTAPTAPAAATPPGSAAHPSSPTRLLIAIDPLIDPFIDPSGTKPTHPGQIIGGLTSLLTSLLELTATALGQVAVVLSVRSDHLDSWFHSRCLTQVLQNQAVWLPPLDAEGWVDAITQPAQLHGYALEPGLLDRLLMDVQRESQPLPLMQMALLQLWQHRDRGQKRLLVSRYDAIGGLAGALNTYAEQVYATLTPDEQAWTQRLCLELTERGQTGGLYRRPRPLADLLALGSLSHQQAQIRQVITCLKLAGLLTVQRCALQVKSCALAAASPPVWVELSQEILCDRWQRLAHWSGTHLRATHAIAPHAGAPYSGTPYTITPDSIAPDSGTPDPGSPDPAYPVACDRGLPQPITCSLDELAAYLPRVPEATAMLSPIPIAHLGDHLATQPLEGALRILAIAINTEQLPTADGLAIKGLLRQTLEVARERYVFHAHPAGVPAFAISPDGTWLVSGGAEGSLRRWDLQGQPLSPPLQGHQDLVAAIAVSPQGDAIVSGSWDGTLCLWDLAGQAIAEPFRGHTDLITAVTFSPDGRLILSASADGTLRLWDRYGNQIRDPWPSHSGVAMAVTFSPDGTTIVLGSTEGTLSFWDWTGQVTFSPIAAHTVAITAVAISPDGTMIVSASSDGTLRLWDRQGQAIGSPFQGHTDSVEAVAFSPDGSLILSGGADMTLRLWDCGGNLVSPPLVGHQDHIEAVTFSPDGCHALSASTDGTIRVWDVWGNRLGPSLRGHADLIEAIAFSPDGSRLVSGGWDCTLRVWDLQGDAAPRLWHGHTDFVAAIAFSHNGQWIASSSWDGVVCLWNTAGECLHRYQLETGVAIACVCFSRDDQWLWAGSADGRIHRWYVPTRQSTEATPVDFQGHTDYVADLVVSPDGTYMISASADGTLRQWSLAGQSLGQPFQGHTAAVTGVAISPDSHWIASGSWDGTLRLWDRQGQAVATLSQGTLIPISAVAFSPDGSQILVGYTNGSFGLWDVAAQAPIGSPQQAHTDFVSSVAFSPDGQMIATSSADRTIGLWRGGNWQDWLRAGRDRLRHHPLVQGWRDR